MSTLALALLATSAQAGTRSYRSEAHQGGLLRFHVSGVSPADVRAARLTVGGYGRTVSLPGLRRILRRGTTVRLREPRMARTAEPAPGRLVVTVARRRPFAERLSWRPPALTRPTTIRLTEDRHWYGLDNGRDYVLELPRGGYGKGGLNIEGGRNVVLVGGHIRVPAAGPSASISRRRGLILVGQTGTVHIEGVRIDGPGLSEGIDLDQRKGAVVQIENVRVGAVRARDELNFTDNHPDNLQTWAGPAELRVDRFTGTTDFQGLMIHPTDVGPYPARRITLKRVNINALPTAHKLFNKMGSDPMTYSDLWAKPPATPALAVWTRVWPVDSWTRVRQRRRPEGDFVPGPSVGAHYASPGYR